MAEILLPEIVTAVADSELEGFISGTLFSQGWSVIYRALDAAALEDFFSHEGRELQNIVLVYTPDLVGIRPEFINSLQGSVKQIIGFSERSDSYPDFVGLISTPKDATSLISVLRGAVRAPMIRSQSVEKVKRRKATVIAIASPSGGAGCTTLSINLAMELSLLGQNTLLMDADVRRASIAPLLGLHKLDDVEVARTVSPKLSVSEFTRARMDGIGPYLDYILQNFDFVVVDLGSVEELEDSLTDRRWTSSMIHWSCDLANEIWFVGKADVLGLSRIEKLSRDFSQISIRAKISVLQNMKGSGKKGGDQSASFISAVSELNPHHIHALPRDSRAVLSSESERGALVEVNSRAPLRRAIQKLAVGLTT
ncbi:MAG: P-loop NTPase [Actinomycetota bacterium]